MATSLLLKAIPLGAGLMYLELNCIPQHIVDVLFSEPSSLVSNVSLPKAFGLVIIVNVIMSGVIMTGLGMKVGKARGTYKDKAIKDGEENAEARYSLPNLYVEGCTENAKRFNCIQRGHQQALESYAQFLALSVVGGLRFPLFTAFNGLLWIYSRRKWAEGYASGDPANRYSHWAGKGIWFTLIFGLMAAAGTAVGVLGIA